MKVMPLSPELISPQGAQSLEKPPGSRQEFENLLGKMMNDVNQLQHDSDQKVSGSLLGQEEMHTAMLSLEKANLGFKLLLQVRNKMVEAYQELARMQI